MIQASLQFGDDVIGDRHSPNLPAQNEATVREEPYRDPNQLDLEIGIEHVAVLGGHRD